MFGEQLVEIQIMIPWWKEMGIFLPLSSEIKNLMVLKGQSFFRYQKAEEVIGTKEGKGVSVSLDNRGETIGLTFFKCKLGLWPELMVMPGDRGGRRVNIGYFPLGGTVMLYLPRKYEILIKINDEVAAGETILAVIPEHA
jgi:phosphatidylserine decarboxylase